jgi:outer membrane protein
MQQKLLIALSVCFAFLLFSAQSALASDSIKVGTIDFQKVLDISKTGKVANNIVTKKFNEFQEKLRAQEESLVVMKDDLDNKSAVWNKTVRTQKEREFNKKVRDFDEESKYATNDFNEFKKQQFDPILKELKTIIEGYGKSKEYSLVLDISAGVLFHDKSLDISNDIATELDKRHPENN